MHEPGATCTSPTHEAMSRERARPSAGYLQRREGKGARARGGARGCREVSEEETIERSFIGSSASVRVKWGDRLAAEMSSTSPELAMIRQTMSSKSASS